MMIHIDQGGERMGPYSLEDVNRYLADGTLQPSDLGWYDGATDWVPLTNIEGVVAAGAVPPPTGGAAGSTCPACQAPVEVNQIVCMGCGTRLKEAPAAGGGKGSKTALIAVGSVVLIAGIVLGVMQPWKKDEGDNADAGKNKGDSVGPAANGGDKTAKPAPPDVDIFKAAGDGNLKALKQHIAAGTNLNQRAPDDQSTPLMIAALFGRTEAAKALIEAGAALDLKKNDGSTALMNAAFFCHTEIVQALLDKGADKNITNNTGSTPLQAVEAPFLIVQLIYGGLDEAIFKPAGMPLDMGRINSTRPKIAKILGGGGGAPGGAGGGAQKGDIFKAAGDGNLEAIKQHIAAGTDLDQRAPDDQSTPLMIAALFGQAEAAKALIEAGAKLDLKNKDGSTALMSAAFFCHPEIVQALLDKGADKNIRNNTGTTALQSVEGPFISVKFFYDIVNGLVFQPAGTPLDYERIQATRPKIAKMLGGSGGAVAGNNGQAMDIFNALKPGNEEALKKLIASGADLNVKGPIGTPLGVAAIYGNTASAILLINGGANVNAAGNDGGTALHAAAFMCRADIVKALLAKGANVNARNGKGETPLSSFALPWPQAQGIYQLVGGLLQLPMDQKELERIQNTRPQIAQMLRQAGGQ